MTFRIVGVTMLLLAAACSPSLAQVAIGPRPQAVDDVIRQEVPEVRVASWIEGLEAPWSLVFLPGGRALVSERPGRIRLIENGALRREPFAQIVVRESGEGGLMGLALHPEFPRAPFLYAMYTHQDAQGITNRVVRLTVTAEGARMDRVIVGDIPGARFHDGGRIAFGPDGMLYVGTGETFQAELAQNMRSLGGKILRLTPDGEVPRDNPVANSVIFSLGHRNVQGLAWHPETKALFASEHGPSGEFGLRAHDEINVIAPGANYGWPLAVGAPGRAPLVDPIVAWPDRTTPPAGIAFWRGDLFVATLRSEALIRIRLERAGEGWRAAAIERWFDSRYGRLRDAVVGPDGALYVLTSNRDGRGRARQGDDRILRIDWGGR
jgi:glucose/arabinose dehydrogenase